jgi:hypothetical protein
MMKKVKILEKAMSREELLEYIKDNPKWRIPTLEEAKQIKFDEDRNFRINNGTMAISVFNAEKEKEPVPEAVNNLLKLDVVLVQRLDTCIGTGTVLYIRDIALTEYLQRENMSYNTVYSKKELENEAGSFDHILEAMNFNDFVVFKQQIKAIDVAIIEKYRTVVRVECPMKMNIDQATLIVDDAFISGDIMGGNIDNSHPFHYQIMEYKSGEEPIYNINVDEDGKYEVTKLIK